MIYAFKRISLDSIPAALAKAEKYRDLNQPAQAESIARDVLAVAPGHREALKELGLALTDQFATRPQTFREAEDIFRQLDDPYESPYLRGLAHERLCRAKIEGGGATAATIALIREAFRCYELAEHHRPAGNDDALLRWNTCARMMAKNKLAAREEDHTEPVLE